MTAVTSGGAIYSRLAAILALIICLAAGWGCSKTEVQPPIPLGQTIQVTATDQFIGSYEREDGAKTISIGYVGHVLGNDEVFNQPNVERVYITSLVEGPETTVEAIWNGVAFIIDRQQITVGLTPTIVSGRVSLHEDELTVFYHLASTQTQQSVSEKYHRIL